MIDLKDFREHLELYQRAAKLKKVEVDWLAVRRLDGENRQLLQQINDQRAKLKANSKRKPEPKEIAALKVLGDEVQKLQACQRETEEKLLAHAMRIPNLPTDDTPEGEDARGNVVRREVGEKQKFSFPPKEHWELGAALDLIDSERAGRVSGSRFVYLKGGLVLLQFALLQHAFSILTSEKILAKIIKAAKLNVPSTPFVPVIPPVFIRPEVMQQMARLEPKEERYYIPSDDLYLVGSAEQTLGPMHADETFEEAELPLRYVGYSTSFRREAGSYGKDTKGLIRVHQFDKIEMESFGTPEASVREQDFFVAIQEYLMQSLGLPYRVVQICTGDMGGPDARQVDLETWLPGQGTYRETHTADLMTDYQSRRLNTRVRRSGGRTELVHMNDATVFAIGRTLAAIMENYQQADGSIAIPEVLRPFMGGSAITAAG